MLCGAAIGGAGGALYSASRSMMVRHCRADNAAEAFGLFALTGGRRRFSPRRSSRFSPMDAKQPTGLRAGHLAVRGGLRSASMGEPQGTETEQTHGRPVRTCLTALLPAMLSARARPPPNLSPRRFSAPRTERSPHKPAPFGGYANGCIAGAAQLPETGSDMAGDATVAQPQLGPPRNPRLRRAAFSRHRRAPCRAGTGSTSAISASRVAGRC